MPTRELIVIFAAIAVAVGAAAVFGCSDSNDCQTLVSDLCSYDSYKADSDGTAAEARKTWCTCVTDGPDKLDTDYQKMACRSALEHIAQLDSSVEADASELAGCRVQGALLTKYKDTYIKTCIQTDGSKACKDDRKKCNDACVNGGADGGAAKADAGGDEEACLNGCALTYPCDEMCGD